MALDFEVLHLPDDSGQRILTYTAAPGTPADTALRLLASHAATLARDSDHHAEHATG